MGMKLIDGKFKMKIILRLKVAPYKKEQKGRRKKLSH